MSCFWLTLTPKAESELEEVCREALELQRRLGVGIEFDFNEVHCYTTPWASVQWMVNEFKQKDRRRQNGKENNGGRHGFPKSESG